MSSTHCLFDWPNINLAIVLLPDKISKSSRPGADTIKFISLGSNAFLAKGPSPNSKRTSPFLANVLANELLASSVKFVPLISPTCFNKPS